MGGFNLDNYNDVPSRMQEFFNKYPDGSLQGSYEFKQIPMYLKDKETEMPVLAGEKTIVIYTAKAYRSPEDQLPGIGTASEPFPGLTPYTKDSEMMNAETSAWGRAILAVGAADTRKGIASREEVQSRKGDW
ncbi:MAG TPA: hypothetical protein VN039_14600 [Nitrospira sp.]|nr:hypothetical protein [Nitrospira sp.]